MTWDKIAMAQKFLRQANAIRPEDEHTGAAHDAALARQDVYYECYMSSFSREELIKRLKQMVLGDFDIPQGKEVDEDRYRDAYTLQARDVLDTLEREP